MKVLRPFVLLALLALLAPERAAAGTMRFGPHDLRSVFHVAKSENQNQVHYAIRLDASCRPVGQQPVFGYWRRLKGGVRVDEPLVSPGTRVYGASDKQEVERVASGGRVRTFVKALQRVRIDIRVEKTAAGCKATPTTTLRGELVRLSHAYLQLGTFALRVKHVDVFGYRVKDGRQVTERFH